MRTGPVRASPVPRAEGAFDLRPIVYIVGWLVVVLGALMALPMLIDLVDRDANAGAFAGSSLVAMVTGTSMVLACAGRRRAVLSQRQAFMLTTACWLALTGMATLPLMLGAPDLDFTDAFFETTSAMTTTGATVIVGLETLPRSVLLWRGIVSWIGGIGVVLLAMMLLPVLRIGGMQLLRTADFNTIDKVMPRAKDLAWSFGSVYVGLTVACAFGYLWGGLSIFDAWVHAMTTIATGGMGNYDASFIAFPPAVHYVGTVFMLLGGLSFVRFVQFARGDPLPLVRDTQVRSFLAIYALLCLGLAVARLLNGEALGERVVREIAFNMASIITTTGFVSADYGTWGSLAAVLFFCAMMVGGCSGSTSGGPKVFRYQILAGALAAEIRWLYRPNQVIVGRFQGRRVSEDVMNSVIAFFMFFFLTLGIGTALLVMIGLDPLSAVSGAAATLSNIGPGLGPAIGPVGNYVGLPDAAIWVMTLLMLLGRLELLTVFVLFTAAFWRG